MLSSTSFGKSALPAGPLSRIGIGCGRLGSLLNPTPLSETRRTLWRALDSGINVFDTANIYAQGDSERILGRMFGNRKDVFITTKGGMQLTSKALLAGKAKPFLKPLVRMTGLAKQVRSVRENAIGKNFSSKMLMTSLEGSLRRLRRDYVDGFFLHDPDLDVLLSEQIWESLRLAKQHGKIRFAGVSIRSAAEIEAACTIADCEIIQAPLRVLQEIRDTDTNDVLRARGIGIFAREVLGSASEKDGAAVKASLQNALSLPDVASVIVGVSRRDHLAQLLAAA